MDLFEYQAKELFAEYGVPVPKDKVADTAEEAREITAAYAAEGTPQVVVKAQVKTGGRGKAGGVKLADGPVDAYEKAQRILGMDIKGHTVHKVLIAEATDIKSEYYLSFLLDRANRTFMSICSVEGGVEIEEVAHSNPGAIARIPVSPLTGVDHAKALEIIKAGRIPDEAAEQAALLAERLWAMFTDEDATLVEVNPMVLTPDGRVLALDGKVTLDDNAAYRQDHGRFADASSTDPIEARAKEKHLNYVKLEGEVGIIGNGAGLVMSTLDVVAYAGEAVRRHPPGELPRHRRRRVRRGDGQRPGDRALRPVGAVGVRERVRRHHRVRRGGQRDRVRGRAADGARRGSEPPDRRPARRQQGGRGQGNPSGGEPAGGGAGGHDGRRGAPRGRAGRRRPREGSMRWRSS